MSEKKETSVQPKPAETTVAPMKEKIDLGEKMDPRMTIGVRPRAEVTVQPSTNAPSAEAKPPQANNSGNSTPSGSDKTKK